MVVGSVIVEFQKFDKIIIVFDRIKRFMTS